MPREQGHRALLPAPGQDFGHELGTPPLPPPCPQNEQLFLQGSFHEAFVGNQLRGFEVHSLYPIARIKTEVHGVAKFQYQRHNCIV